MCDRPKKVAKRDAGDFSSSSILMIQNDEYKIEFVVRLCGDVLVEILRYGSRRRLTKLERVGRRFNWIVGRCYPEVPYLRLNLALKSRLSHDPRIARILPRRIFYTDLSSELGFGALIGHREFQFHPGELISLTSLASFPSFIRFNKVELTYGIILEDSIDEMCELTENHLRPIASALKATKMVTLNGGIGPTHASYFSDHSKLLEFLRNRLLPICDSSHGYNFSIHLASDFNSADEIIASIFQLQQIRRCFHAEFRFEFEYKSDNQPVNLPVELVSNWLHRTSDENGNKKQQERFLLMYSNKGIENSLQIWNCLKRVFDEAKSPSMPFTFELRCHADSVIEEQTLLNRKTGEELSVHRSICYWVEIKRGAAKKKEKAQS